jgi:Protein of unknown function (DUF1573)
MISMLKIMNYKLLLKKLNHLTMRQTIFMLFAFMFISLSVSAQPTEKIDGPEISFEKTTINYGKIKKDSEPLRKFSFKNIGNKPLLITNAQGSCGCTVPDYPKHAIGAGESANVDVRYDTKRVGPFSKTVTVTTNDGKQTILTISGEVTE